MQSKDGQEWEYNRILQTVVIPWVDTIVPTQFEKNARRIS